MMMLGGLVDIDMGLSCCYAYSWFSECCFISLIFWVVIHPHRWLFFGFIPVDVCSLIFILMDVCSLGLIPVDVYSFGLLIIPSLCDCSVSCGCFFDLCFILTTKLVQKVVHIEIVVIYHLPSIIVEILVANAHVEQQLIVSK